MSTRMTSAVTFTSSSCQAGATAGRRPGIPGDAPTPRRAGRRGSARGGDTPDGLHRGGGVSGVGSGSRVGLEVQDAVAPAPTSVDDAGAVGVGVVEEEEVVPDELHLVHRVLEGHG